MSEFFKSRKLQVFDDYNSLLKKRNKKKGSGNGIFSRYRNPVLTADHIPPQWIYDLNPETNPYFMTRMGVNSVFNPAAIELDGKIFLVARVEGYDRKSFFAIAESESGVDNFRFHDFPLEIPPMENAVEVNYADMRLTRHEDGWIYGSFDTEIKDEGRPNDLSAIKIKCAIMRTKDLKHWERLPNLQMPDNTPCDCILHPELINGQYAFYIQSSVKSLTMDTAQGVRLAILRSIENPVVEEIRPINRRRFFSVNESGTGPGAPPFKTPHGWIHLAYGTRYTDAGVRSVLYTFMTDLKNPLKVIYEPGGYLLAPEGKERMGDEGNKVFSNGWVIREDGSILIYYSSSDTRVHVASTNIDKMLDYLMNTPPDGRDTRTTTSQRMEMIRKNMQYLK
jgi:4-O-beta-D-mannosyl-D-glucose phosphorylase